MQKKPLPSGYRWVIVACCFLMIFTVLGFGSTPRKLYMVAVPKALELDYGPYSLGDSFRYPSTAIVNLFFGALVMKFGPRRLIGMGFAALTASMLAFSFAKGLAGIYLGSMLLGMGLTLTGSTMSSYAVNIWCKKNKGTITGLVLCANGLGGALATQVLSPIINASLFSYRDAYRLTALIMAAVGVMIVLFFRNSPGRDDALPEMKKKEARSGTWEGVTLRQAVKKPYFYMAAACIFFAGMVLQSMVGSDANHMAHAGLDKGYIASALSLHSLALAGCKFMTGVLYDRKGLKTTMLVCYTASLGTVLLLIGVNDSAAGRGMAMGYSILSAFALPLETIMLPLMTAELFGQRSYAQMLGVISAINTAGYAFGPPVTNYLFDFLGTYVPVFWAYLFVMAAVMAGFMAALAASAKERAKTA